MKALLILLTLFTTSVLADGYHHGGYGYYNYGYNNNFGAFMGGAVAGAIIGGMANSYRYAPPPPVYYPPPAVYYPPPVYAPPRAPFWDPYCNCYR